MDLRNLIENIGKRKLAIIVGVVLLFTVIVLVIANGGDKQNIDSRPEEGTSQDYKTSARIVGGEDLFQMLEGDKRYDSFTEDLFMFGQTAYSDYKDLTGKVIGFTIKSKLDKKADAISFSGQYGSSKNTIKITLTLRKNQRLTSSITDTKTGLNIDSDLPSNSKMNEYIANLPVAGDGYIAEYSVADGNVVITIDERDSSLSERAFTDIQAVVDDGSYNKKQIQIIFPPSGGV